MKRFFKKLLAGLFVLCLFAGLMRTDRVSAAGPNDSEKAGATPITLGLSEKGVTVGTSSLDSKSTYFTFKTKRVYNVKIAVNTEYDCTEQMEIQVWNNKGELVKNASQTKSTWSFSKKKNASKNVFSVKLKKGTYYIEIKEKGSSPDRNYTVKVVPVMVEKIKGVTAVQNGAGSKTATVSWTPLEGEAITGYKVYRSTKKNGTYKLVDTIWGIDSSSAEVKVKPGKTYYYKVRAYYFSSNSDKNLFTKYSKAVKLVTTK